MPGPLQLSGRGRSGKRGTWYAALYLAQIIVGTVAGQWLMGRTRETWALIGRMAVGVVIVRLATVIPVAGGWIKFAEVLWRLGAISLALYNSTSLQDFTTHSYQDVAAWSEV